MSGMIVVCLVLLVYGLTRQTGGFQEKVQETRTVTLPRVSTIQMMSPYKNGIALYVATPQGDFIYFADPAHGLSSTRLSIKRED
jgi:hypothetical protein